IKGGAATLAGIGKQSKRAHHEDRTARLRHVEVHLAALVFEDAQIADLVRKLHGIVDRVFDLHADVNQEPTINGGSFVRFGLDTSAQNPLNDSAHIPINL